MDGYISATFDIQTAFEFANNAHTEGKEKVLMKITLQNESGKHYICLDRSDYTCYPLEREILLQAGISARVEFSYEKSVNGEPFTVFNLYISEEQVQYFKLKTKLMIIIPFLVYFST